MLSSRKLSTPNRMCWAHGFRLGLLNDGEWVADDMGLSQFGIAAECGRVGPSLGFMY